MKRPIILAIALMVATALVSALSSTGDVLVTDHPYIRHDGGTDVTITRCSSDATTPTAGGDDAGNRQQNEPAVAINPQNTLVMRVTASVNTSARASKVGSENAEIVIRPVHSTAGA